MKTFLLLLIVRGMGGRRGGLDFMFRIPLLGSDSRPETQELLSLPLGFVVNPNRDLLDFVSKS